MFADREKTTAASRIPSVPMERHRPEGDERQPEADEDEVRRGAGHHRVDRIEESPSSEEERRGRETSLQPRCKSRSDYGYEYYSPPSDPGTEGDDAGSVERGRHRESRRYREAPPQLENGFGDLCGKWRFPNFQSPPVRSNRR